MSFRQPSAAFFSVVAGSYVGLLALGGTGLVHGTGYVTPWSVAAGGCAGLLVALRSYLSTAPATALVRTRLYLLPFIAVFIPIFAVLVLQLADIPGYETWVTAWLGEYLVFALAGTIFYFVTVNRHVASLRERESILAEWTSYPDTRYRRLVHGLGFALGCVCIVGGLLLALSDHLVINPLPAVGGAMIGQAITGGRQRTYTLFESGLCVRRSKTFNYQFVPCTQLRSLDLTDDRLEIRRGLPWPLPIRCATTPMTQPQQVAAAIERALESGGDID
ncbi:hypothetical protein [Natrinema versiforme]|uniref:hypothetical protein n=1 Tax=Natrinema versiforme TaxID=88724 RepID=UPI000677593F|nr:hypothetical protein [Natrinema versiforme]